MRALLVLIGLAALVVAGLLASGMMTMQTTPGSLPRLHLDGGKAPAVKADVATITVGTESKSIDVPTVGTTSKTITVPTVTMNKPAQPGNTATAQ
jgi:hypothetical protein